MVNNAGVFIAKPFTQYTVDDYANVTAVNLAGFFHITQRVIAQMLTQGHGGHNRRGAASSGCIGVSMTRGETALTPIRLGARSMASDFVAAARPPWVSEASTDGTFAECSSWRAPRS